MNRLILSIVLFLSIIGMIFWFFFDIILYVLVSLVISTILRPITDYLHNFEVFGVNIPRILAVLVSFLVLAVLPIVVVLLFAPLLGEQIQVLRNIRFEEFSAYIQEPIKAIENFILYNFPNERKPGFLIQEINHNILNFLERLDFGVIFNYVLQFTGKVLFYLVAITFITFFLLYEKGIIRRSILAIIPNAYFEVVITTLYKIEKLLSNYLIGLLGQVTIMFTVISVGLGIMGIKYALTIAAFMAFINLIPYLGPVLGILFGIFVVFSTDLSPNESFNVHFYTAFRILPVFAIAVFMDNLVVQPYIFSKSVKAHPLEIFFAIFMGATFAGPLGMIAAIPVYTTFRVSLIELTTGYRQYRIFKPHKKIG